MSVSEVPVAGASQSKVLRNSFWYGLETGLDVIIGTVLSIVVARSLGPAILGEFVFLAFITNIVGKFAGAGFGVAARKYVSEYLAKNNLGMVRSVFFATLRLQVLLSAAIFIIGAGAALLFLHPGAKLVGVLLVAAIVPQLLVSIPSLTNVAAEDFYRNVPGAIAGLVTYAVVVVLTLTFDWYLVGIASALLLRRTVEFIVRLVPALRWMYSLPHVDEVPQLSKELVAFSGQAIGSLVIMTIIWDRSEFLFLKYFCDIKQVAFYSVAFGLSEYLLSVPNVFGGAITARFMSTYTLDKARAGRETGASIRYLLLILLPIHFGLAAIADPLVRFAYGAAYAPAIPVIIAAALLAIPKGLYWLPPAVYQIANRQDIMLRRLLVAGVLNVVIDAILIPKYGAIGAALGNGLAQAFAVVLLWTTAAKLTDLQVPWGGISRIFGSAAAMFLSVYLISSSLGARLGLVVGIVAGIGCYPVFLRLTRALDVCDMPAIESVVNKLPSRSRSVGLCLVRFVARANGPEMQVAASTST